MLCASCCCARLCSLFILQVLQMKPRQKKKPQATNVLSFGERPQQPRLMELGKPAIKAANSGLVRPNGQVSACLEPTQCRRGAANAGQSGSTILKQRCTRAVRNSSGQTQLGMRWKYDQKYGRTKTQDECGEDLTRTRQPEKQ